MELVIPDMKRGYETVVKSVLLYGDKVSPRGVDTHEVVNASIILTDPTQSLPLGIARGINSKIAAVEALQLLGGVIDPQLMVKASPHFAQFMDGGTFHGGYGQRTRAQMIAAVNRLREDPSSRRALVTIWDPMHDLYTEGVKDYPCTIALQFLVREGELQLHTHMRSNDVWRGFAYDVFVFTQLQLAVAQVLRLSVGSYYHHVTSLHMYETDLPAWHAMGATDVKKDYSPTRYTSLVDDVSTVERMQEIARVLLGEDGNVMTPEVTSMWEWYKERV